MFARAAALELAPKGIRVNVAVSGLTLTPKITESFSKKPDLDAYTKQQCVHHPDRAARAAA